MLSGSEELVCCRPLRAESTSSEVKQALDRRSNGNIVKFSAVGDIVDVKQNIVGE